jgi:signal transduction histidine kinase
VDRADGYRGLGTDERCERDHELRAGLSGIEAAALALREQRDRRPSGDVDQLVLAIASEARRLRALVSAKTVEHDTFELADAIRPAVLTARSMGLIVHDRVPHGLWVSGRRDDVAEVVLGLLENAIEHAAPSPVDLWACADRGATTLFVEDRGPGIRAVHLDSVFERGRRGSRSSGSGLGLFIARRLMNEQGGSLTVSQRRGGGASFAVTLPSAASARSEAFARRLALQDSDR